MKYHYGTKDSYSENYSTATPSELADKVINDLQERRFNRYYGGKTNSISASLDYHRPAFEYKNNLIILGTQEEFQEFEAKIKAHVEYFTPRDFNNI